MLVIEKYQIDNGKIKKNFEKHTWATTCSSMMDEQKDSKHCMRKNFEKVLKIPLCNAIELYFRCAGLKISINHVFNWKSGEHSVIREMLRKTRIEIDKEDILDYGDCSEYADSQEEFLRNNS